MLEFAPNADEDVRYGYLKTCLETLPDYSLQDRNSWAGFIERLLTLEVNLSKHSQFANEGHGKTNRSHKENYEMSKERTPRKRKRPRKRNREDKKKGNNLVKFISKSNDVQ